MKNTTAYLAIAALLAACSAATPTDDLGKKRAELDSLKANYAATAELSKQVDAWIAEHDSTVKKNIPAVTAFELLPTRFEHFIQVHGTVRADKSADLYTMGGRVRRILVQEGQRVSAGQLLIDLDNDAFAKQATAAEAGAKLARDVYEKQSKLWEQKIGSEIQFLQAKSQMEQAEAGLAALREQVRLSNVTAPFSGVVDEIMVSEGDMTSPMAPVARVVDASGATLEADVPETYVKRVKRGDPVKVEFPGTGDTLMAELANVSSFIDRANRTFKVSVRVPAGDIALHPNLLSVIHVRDQVMDSALVVPARLIQEDVNGNSYLFALDSKEGKRITRKVHVTPVATYKGFTVLAPGQADGLNGGETLVDEGAKNVADGQEVKVLKL